MGLKTKRDRLCVVQLSTGDGNAHLVQFAANSDYKAPNLAKFLNNPQILKIFHFARFDIAALEYYLGVNIDNVYCTKIASRLARTYTEFHGLKDLCNELVGVSISKAQQSSNWGQEELTDAQKKYAAQDVLYLHEIMDKLDKMLEGSGRKDMAQRCFDFLKTRVELDMAGWSSLDIFKH